MKSSAIPVLVGLTSLALTTNLSAQEPSPVDQEPATVAELGPHHRVWQRVEWVPDGAGGALALTNSITELAVGIGRWDDAAKTYVPAKAEFELTQSGHFIARYTQHQVILAPDLTEAGAVDLLTPDQQRLTSTLLGLALLDTASGKSAMIAELQHCRPEWISPTEVVYRDALDDIGADVVYRIGLDRFVQDLLLTSQIPPELLGELGFNPKTTRVLVMTEFFEAPEPDVTPWTRQSLEGRELGDTDLGFGVMSMGPGAAFPAEGEMPETAAPVGKSWIKLDGRQFLIETVEYMDLVPLLEKLPMPGQAAVEAIRTKVQRTARVGSPGAGAVREAHAVPRALPAKLVRQAKTGEPVIRGRHIEVDEATLVAFTRSGRTSLAGIRPRTGVLVDYALQISTAQTDYTFAGDKTYYISASVPLTGVTAFESGTVIKFAPTNNARLTVKGPITWQGSPYRPAILTARDDASVGDAVSGAGTLSGYYAAVALEIDRATNTTPAILQNFRISHAQTAVSISGRPGHVFSHGQLVHCQRGFSSTNAEFSLRNMLFDNVLTNLTGTSSTGRCEHVTANTATHFNYNSACAYLYLTNSLLAGVTNVGTVTTSVGSVTLASASGVFQTMGKGNNYLAAGSPYRNYSTASTNLNASLAKALKLLTTYPPIELTSDFTVSTVLVPQAERDASANDLGFHHECLDYVWTGRNLTNATLVLTNGVAVGVYGTTGLRLLNGAVLLSEGRPDRLNRLVRYQAVQEQSGVWGTTGSTMSVLSVPSNPATLPEVRLRFTDIALLANTDAKRRICDWGYDYELGTLAMTDCLTRGGTLSCSYDQEGDGRVMTVALTNSLFQRVNFILEQETASPRLSLLVWNCLFKSGTLEIDNYTPGTYSVYDTAFDSVALYATGVANGNNGYINTTAMSGGASNIVLAAFTYAEGPLGSFYQSTTNFYDAGSRTPSAAGLFHHTVKTTANSKEGTDAVQTVDIGFHYVGTDANGIPLDTDGDGLPDYFEDRNGSGGNPDSGETHWQSASDLGLKVWITKPKAGGNLP